MPQRLTFFLAAALLLGGHAQAQVQAPAEQQNRVETQIQVQSQTRTQTQFIGTDVSGHYRCEPQPAPCRASTFSAAQSGDKVELKSDSGEIGEARLTSRSTLSAGAPFNMLGVIRAGAIEWSNGTRWVKQ
jgi:hypothetical protein